MIFEDTTTQKQAVAKREQRYTRGELTRHITTLTSESKALISEGVKKYARENPEAVKKRAKKSVQTRIDNGYFEKKKMLTVESDIIKFKSYGFTAVHLENRVYKLQCQSCVTSFTRGAGQWSDNMCPQCGRSKSTSILENEIYNEVVKMVGGLYEVEQSNKSLLSPFEVDILIPDLKLGIEVNGLFWHSEKAGKNKWYHKTKLNKCLEQGYELIQIFEDEWIKQREKVILRLKHKLNLNKERIFARKCEVQKITANDAFAFFEETHIQGRGYGSHFYGLFYNGNLVSCMSFARPNKAKGYSNSSPGVFELNRFSSRILIVGGASKLFRAFINSETNISSVISYSDLRWNNGKVYEKLGFTKVGETTPGYWYVRGIDRIHRFKLRKTESDPAEKTEHDIRHDQGYNIIWDCGHSKWVWNKQ